MPSPLTVTTSPMGSPRWIPKSLIDSLAFLSARLLARDLVEDLPRPLHRLTRLADAYVDHDLADGDPAASGSSTTSRLAHLYACTSIAGLSDTHREDQPRRELGLSARERSVIIFSLETVPFLTSEILPIWPALSPERTSPTEPFVSLIVEYDALLGYLEHDRVARGERERVV